MTSDQGGTHGEPTGRPEGGSEPTAPQGVDHPAASAAAGLGRPAAAAGLGRPAAAGAGARRRSRGRTPAAPAGLAAAAAAGLAAAGPAVRRLRRALGAAGSAPGSAEQPPTVRAGIGAFVANLVLGIVGSLVDLRRHRRPGRRGARAPTTDPDVTEEVTAHGDPASAPSSAWSSSALHALFIWFAWQGRNWARIVLWVLGGLGVLAGFGGARRRHRAAPASSPSLGVFQLLLAASPASCCWRSSRPTSGTATAAGCGRTASRAEPVRRRLRTPGQPVSAVVRREQAGDGRRSTARAAAARRR